MEDMPQPFRDDKDNPEFWDNAEYENYNDSTSAPQPKVVAATVGGGVGAAVATILVWTLEATTGVDVPEGVELAAGVVITSALAFIGGYWKSN